MGRELSKAEWVVMNLCWEKGKSTARQIYEAIGADREWEYQTVKTMLDRIVKKGYLKREKLGPLCLYKPCVRQKRVVSDAIDSFFSTVMDDGLAPLFAHLAESRKLDKEEIESLKKLIDEHKGE
ncbi:BlaI/MecI/CopY family transcriptional regulator [Pontiella sp.]|uniref:BlaI/MecI/CopY family transcriptional regulator n=1 Tax=Pontiella sp. TaxID=2837462 RepID=UPI003562CBBA